jgi:hypothetical protein
MSEIIMLSNVRLSFPQLTEPRAFQEGQPKKYSADLILPLDSPDFKSFMQSISQMAQAKWGENAGAVLQMVQGDRKLRCFGMGTEKIDKKTFKPYLGYEGMAYINASNGNMPQMIETSGKAVPIDNTMAYMAQARKMYGGCYVNAAIKPWIQDNAFGRGIRCELVALQFAKDGEAFGEGVVDASSLFSAVAPAPTTSAAPAGMPFPSFMQ